MDQCDNADGDDSCTTSIRRTYEATDGRKGRGQHLLTHFARSPAPAAPDVIDRDRTARVSMYERRRRGRPVYDACKVEVVAVRTVAVVFGRRFERSEREVYFAV